MKLFSILTIIIFAIFPALTIIAYGIDSIVPFFMGSMWTAIQLILYKFAKGRGE